MEGDHAPGSDRSSPGAQGRGVPISQALPGSSSVKCCWRRAAGILLSTRKGSSFSDSLFQMDLFQFKKALALFIENDPPFMLLDHIANLYFLHLGEAFAITTAASLTF